MTEEELIKQGFTKVDVPKTESGDTTDYYYYIYEFSNGWQIISCASDEAKDNSWNVQLDHVDNLYISDMLELMILITFVRKWLKSQKCG